MKVRGADFLLKRIKVKARADKLGRYAHAPDLKMLHFVRKNPTSMATASLLQPVLRLILILILIFSYHSFSITYIIFLLYMCTCVYRHCITVRASGLQLPELQVRQPFALVESSYVYHKHAAFEKWLLYPPSKFQPCAVR